MNNRIKGLDGLRAIAVLYVFITHKFGITTLGGYGVHLFFVLSGFLIIAILHGQRRQIEGGKTSLWDAWKNFMLKRCFRIFPIYYVTLALVALILAPPVAHLLLSATYLSNASLVFPPHDFLPHVGHFWSLAVEEQFYLAAAPLFLAVPSRHTVPICWLIVAGALIGSLAVIWMGLSSQILYGGPVSNFGLMALGGIAALSPRLTRTPAWIGPAALCVYLSCPFLSDIFLGKNTPASLSVFWISPVLIAIVLTSFVVHQDTRIVGLLESYPVRVLGRISYGFYLFHPFIVLENFSVGFPRNLVIRGILKCADFVVAVTLAGLSWKFFEAPMLRAGRKLVHARSRPPVGVQELH